MMVMSLPVHKGNVTILELVAGSSVAVVMNGTTAFVREQTTRMQRKTIMFLFVTTVNRLAITLENHDYVFIQQ